MIIPWEMLRPDLELQPLALKEPLFIRKDKTGVRYAFYRFKTGDTLYSSVIIRFISITKNIVRKKNILDLLKLNEIQNAHQIPKDQIIKIPLKWIKSEYFHQVPSIYRNFFEYKSTQTFSKKISSENIPHKRAKKYNSNIISLR